MIARLSPPLLAIGAVVFLGLAGCNQTEEPAPPAKAASTTPDPNAPAPGSQAAEAIGTEATPVAR